FERRATVVLDRDLGRDRVAREHEPDEPHVDLAPLEERLAPSIEEHAVRGTRGLHPLRDETRQVQALGERGVGVVVPAPRIRADELFAHEQLARETLAHDAPSVAAGVNDTSELHTGSSGAPAVATVVSTST